LQLDKVVHVITDRSANPNPGPDGWGAVIRQNGPCTFDFGHYDLARNNTMEIRAVVEASRVLAEGMHVWVSTDSAYVKKGITEWLPNWIRNGWRNSQGAAVANKSLWQALIHAVSRVSQFVSVLLTGAHHLSRGRPRFHFQELESDSIGDRQVCHRIHKSDRSQTELRSEEFHSCRLAFTSKVRKCKNANFLVRPMMDQKTSWNRALLFQEINQRSVKSTWFWLQPDI
jgi:ribonuclease HI